MTCTNYRSGLIEMARGGPADFRLDGHVQSCPECSRFLEDQITLTSAVRTLATDDPATAMPQLEAMLLAEFDAVNRPKEVRSFGWVRLFAGAMAACLAMAVVAWVLTQKPAPPSPVVAKTAVLPAVVTTPVEAAAPAPEVARVLVAARPVRHRRKSAAVAQQVTEPEEPFFQIPYTIPLAPYERANVVRMEMPVAALIAAGFPVRAANAAAQAQADVVVGEDGRARAVRVISISSNE